MKQKKGLKKKQRCFFLGAVCFFVTKKCREKKDEQGISKNSSKIKRIIYFTHSFQKQTNKRTEKERKMADRDKAEDVFTIF